MAQIRRCLQCQMNVIPREDGQCPSCGAVDCATPLVDARPSNSPAKPSSSRTRLPFIARLAIFVIPFFAIYLAALAVSESAWWWPLKFAMIVLCVAVAGAILDYILNSGSGGNRRRGIRWR